MVWHLHQIIKLSAGVLTITKSSAVYQMIGFLIVGYLDPFFLIALAMGMAIAFIIAIIVGIPFIYKRSKKVTIGKADRGLNFYSDNNQ